MFKPGPATGTNWYMTILFYVEIGPELTNQGIYIQTFPCRVPMAISFKILPNNYFIKTFEHRYFSWWCYINKCKLIILYLLPLTILASLTANRIFSYLYKVGRWKVFSTTQMSELQRPQTCQLNAYLLCQTMNSSSVCDRRI